MEIGIIGFAKSGKTTLFNALTRCKAETATYSTTVTAPNLGVAKVPDSRLQGLTEIFQPGRTLAAEVQYIDIAASLSSPGKVEGIAGQFLNQLSNTDALLHVVRAFENAEVPHFEGSIDPVRDIATMDLELTFSDLAIIERRLQRLEVSLKGAKPVERTGYLREQTLLIRIKSALEKEIPLREQSLTGEERKLIASYQFLTAKPLMIIANIGENQLSQAHSVEVELVSSYSRLDRAVAAICGKLEMDLAQLDDKDAEEFRQDLGLTEPALHRIIQLSYRILGLRSFFTVGSDEVKAWTIPQGTTALKAAGKIHSDIERGFIRAEVIGYNDLVRCQSLAQARKQGLLCLEGKNYIVQDGDVITFLFNV